MIPFLNYIVWDPSPIAFRLGSFAVHYYAFCWMIGLGLGLALMQKIYKQQGFKVEQAQSLFFYIFIGVLIGGRLVPFLPTRLLPLGLGPRGGDAPAYSPLAGRRLAAHGL